MAYGDVSLERSGGDVTVVTSRDLVDAHSGTYMLNHKLEVNLDLLYALSFWSSSLDRYIRSV